MNDSPENPPKRRLLTWGLLSLLFTAHACVGWMGAVVFALVYPLDSGNPPPTDLFTIALAIFALFGLLYAPLAGILSAGVGLARGHRTGLEGAANIAALLLCLVMGLLAVVIGYRVYTE